MKLYAISTNCFDVYSCVIQADEDKGKGTSACTKSVSERLEEEVLNLQCIHYGLYFVVQDISCPYPGLPFFFCYGVSICLHH